MAVPRGVTDAEGQRECLAKGADTEKAALIRTLSTGESPPAAAEWVVGTAWIYSKWIYLKDHE